MSNARSRNKLSAALQSKDPVLIKECAVLVIQSSWKARRAMREIKKLKLEKYNLILEMAARKIQKLYRHRKAVEQQRHRKARASPRALGSFHVAVELEHEK